MKPLVWLSTSGVLPWHAWSVKTVWEDTKNLQRNSVALESYLLVITMKKTLLWVFSCIEIALYTRNFFGRISGPESHVLCSAIRYKADKHGVGFGDNGCRDSVTTILRYHSPRGWLSVKRRYRVKGTGTASLHAELGICQTDSVTKWSKKSPNTPRVWRVLKADSKVWRGNCSRRQCVVDIDVLGTVHSRGCRCCVRVSRNDHGRYE